MTNCDKNVNQCFLDKINQWGHEFRDSYTRLGLLKPFMVEKAAFYCLTGTATVEDIKVPLFQLHYTIFHNNIDCL